MSLLRRALHSFVGIVLSVSLLLPPGDGSAVYAQIPRRHAIAPSSKVSGKLELAFSLRQTRELIQKLCLAALQAGQGPQDVRKEFQKNLPVATKVLLTETRQTGDAWHFEPERGIVPTPQTTLFENQVAQWIRDERINVLFPFFRYSPVELEEFLSYLYPG